MNTKDPQDTTVRTPSGIIVNGLTTRDVVLFLVALAGFPVLALGYAGDQVNHGVFWSGAVLTFGAMVAFAVSVDSRRGKARREIRALGYASEGAYFDAVRGKRA